MACEIYIPDSKQLFSSLHEQKEEIEAELTEHIKYFKKSSLRGRRPRQSGVEPSFGTGLLRCRSQ
ncbi:MAG: hypothetical protein RQ783_04315 [Gammaproteobacteria bacterium]|nr:hypothetical protein [Gammaproteobacteria bacterium]